MNYPAFLRQALLRLSTISRQRLFLRSAPITRLPITNYQLSAEHAAVAADGCAVLIILNREEVLFTAVTHMTFIGIRQFFKRHPNRNI